ncbi:unnamed protein product [Effrenium voratum]|nr:unnamed protein product [Effrenium voratum]
MRYELTSCVSNPRSCGGDGGCTGATAQLAFDYAAQKGGLSDIWMYPYLSGTKYSTEECKGTNGTVYLPKKASITGHVNVPKNDAAALMEAISKGPVAVSVDATDWWMYAGGIWDSCNKTAPNINHAVTLEGYGEENGTKYWLIRNSWGNNFGENGYIRLRRWDDEPCGDDPAPLQGSGCKVGEPAKIYACGECGVLSDSSYPMGAKLGERYVEPEEDEGDWQDEDDWHV